MDFYEKLHWLQGLDIKLGPRINYDAIDCGPALPEPNAGMVTGLEPKCECGAKRGELHFQFCPKWER